MATLFDWSGILKQTRFANKADCLANAFRDFTPETINPTAVGANPCQEDIFQILEDVRQVLANGEAQETSVTLATVEEILPAFKRAKKSKEN